MPKFAVGIGLLVLLFGPASCLLAVATVMNPAAQASCLAPPPLSVGAVPGQLTATAADGTRVALSRAQLINAATIIDVGAKTDGIGRDGIRIALMAALTESSLKVLANTGAYPESARYPNDGDGGDHDSLGLFQMRPSTGWGTVAQLMDAGYQARAFYGGPTGPNRGSPRGLLDIPGWATMPPGAAAQAVEVSAYPDRYANFAPVADAILDAVAVGSGGGRAGASTSEVVFPLPAGTWRRTSIFGPRADPITGDFTTHTGVDYAAPLGTPILAVAAGRVAFAGAVSSGYAHLILIEHQVGGRTVASGYAHMYAEGVDVRVGQRVAAGQRIGAVGSDGKSTGPHLHFEIRPGGADSAAIDPEPWLREHRAGNLDGAAAASDAAADCSQEEPAPQGPAPAYDGGQPNRMVDDPTSSGQITARTAYVLAQIRQRFSNSSWACWRAGDSRSEHPKGRACDGTFGNAIGQAATGAALEFGWRVTNWLRTNARTLGVEYLIWQGRIWSLARDAEGWRSYDGGGMHDPTSITGAHRDHLHVTVT
ncbi:M23 family metallopeptidase [Nocardioides sp. YIM 152588]|uniref:M23 family metallopeptidase n=1 Tax=Nocardioides sp. YIM 152588 TaxID=3158259 RepID=UPI0032E4A1A1